VEILDDGEVAGLCCLVHGVSIRDDFGIFFDLLFVHDVCLNFGKKKIQTIAPFIALGFCSLLLAFARFCSLLLAFARFCSLLLAFACFCSQIRCIDVLLLAFARFCSQIRCIDVLLLAFARKFAVLTCFCSLIS
jgi:hypothetical protein